MGVEVVLTTDRTMISDHRGKEFMGFGTTGPNAIFPEWFWLWLFAPKVRTDPEGRPIVAPYGFRKVEADLINHGINAAIIDPDHLEKHLDTAKVVMLSHHDYFGFGPPSSTFASIFKTETINARSFKKLMNSPVMEEFRRKGVRFIAGGPAVWQFRYRENLRRAWKIETLVYGEGEGVSVALVKRALRGDPLPREVYAGPLTEEELSYLPKDYVVVDRPEDLENAEGEVIWVRYTPSLDEISEIIYPSVNGLVEVMRGCPRGCKFCSVTLRPLRFYPFEKIEKEILVNVRAGIVDGIIHSEDVLLYGARGVIPNAEKVIKLNQLFKKHYRKVAWAHASIAAIVKGEKDEKLMTRVSEVLLDDSQEYWGAEIGIETGSPKLAKKIMPAKAAPFPVEKWPELVVEAAAIMEKVNLIPAMTLITGLPGETEEDVLLTLDLIDELWDFPALIMPMFFVPMGMLQNERWFEAYQLSEVHMELLKKCLTRGVRFAKKILRMYFKDKWWHPLLIPIVRWFIDRMERMARKKNYLCYPGEHRKKFKELYEKIEEEREKVEVY